MLNVSDDAREFDINNCLFHFLKSSTFYTELSRHLLKYPTRDIPTAGVTYDLATEQLLLYYNPDFLASLSQANIVAVMKHEFNHIVFGHISARKKDPIYHRMWNVATDLAINSILLEYDTSTECTLPENVLLPGVFPKIAGNAPTKEQMNAMGVAGLIASFPKLMSSEWYFEKLKEYADKHPEECGDGECSCSGEGNKDDAGQGDQDGDASGGRSDHDSNGKGKGKCPKCGKHSAGGAFGYAPIDDHSTWNDLPDEVRERIEQKIKSVVEKAVKAADKSSTGWGSMPDFLRDEIRRSVSTVIDWRTVLRQFVGHLVRGARTASIKRINRKYPYVHPGTKRGYVAKLLIARDESGSVGNEMLADFFAEISALTKKVDIDFVPFDCTISEKDVVKWSRSTTPDKASKRTRCGGTDFNAPTRLFNNPKNRGRWDGLLILTDGQAPVPEPCRGKRGWVLGKGTKLIFPSDELQIYVSKDKPITGAWR